MQEGGKRGGVCDVSLYIIDSLRVGGGKKKGEEEGRGRGTRILGTRELSESVNGMSIEE